MAKTSKESALSFREKQKELGKKQINAWIKKKSWQKLIYFSEKKKMKIEDVLDMLILGKLKITDEEVFKYFFFNKKI